MYFYPFPYMRTYIHPLSLISVDAYDPFFPFMLTSKVDRYPCFAAIDMVFKGDPNIEPFPYRPRNPGYTFGSARAVYLSCVHGACCFLFLTATVVGKHVWRGGRRMMFIGT